MQDLTLPLVPWFGQLGHALVVRFAKLAGLIRVADLPRRVAGRMLRSLMGILRLGFNAGTEGEDEERGEN